MLSNKLYQALTQTQDVSLNHASDLSDDDIECLGVFTVPRKTHVDNTDCNKVAKDIQNNVPVVNSQLESIEEVDNDHRSFTEEHKKSNEQHAKSQIDISECSPTEELDHAKGNDVQVLSEKEKCSKLDCADFSEQSSSTVPIIDNIDKNVNSQPSSVTKDKKCQPDKGANLKQQVRYINLPLNKKFIKIKKANYDHNSSTLEESSNSKLPENGNKLPVVHLNSHSTKYVPLLCKNGNYKSLQIPSTVPLKHIIKDKNNLYKKIYINGKYYCVKDISQSSDNNKEYLDKLDGSTDEMAKNSQSSYNSRIEERRSMETQTEMYSCLSKNNKLYMLNKENGNEFQLEHVNIEETRDESTQTDISDERNLIVDCEENSGESTKSNQQYYTSVEKAKSMFTLKKVFDQTLNSTLGVCQPSTSIADNHSVEYDHNDLRNNIPNPTSLTLSSKACATQNHQQLSAPISQLLTKVSGDIKSCLTEDENGNLPLHHAILNYDLTKLKSECIVLKFISSHLNHTNADFESPLILAVRIAIDLKKYDAVNILLAEGADQTIMDQNGMLPLHYAARSGCIPLLKMLLSADGSATILNKFSYDGFAAIHLAAMEGHEQAVEYLVVKGADIDIKDRKSGRTAYFHAVEGQKISVAVILRMLQASTTEPNFAGQQPPAFKLKKTPSTTSSVSNCPQPQSSPSTNIISQSVCGTTQFKDPPGNLGKSILFNKLVNKSVEGPLVSQMNISDGSYKLSYLNYSGLAKGSNIQKVKNISKPFVKKDSLTKAIPKNVKKNLVKTSDLSNMSCKRQDNTSKSSPVNEFGSEINIVNASAVPPSIIGDIPPKHVIKTSNIQLNKNSLSLLKPKFNKNVNSKDELPVIKYTEKTNSSQSLLKINNSNLGNSVMTNCQSKERISQQPKGSVDPKAMLTVNKYFHKPKVSGRDCSKNNTTSVASTIPVRMQQFEKSQQKDNNSRLGYIEVPSAIKSSHQAFLAHNKNHANTNTLHVQNNPKTVPFNVSHDMNIERLSSKGNVQQMQPTFNENTINNKHVPVKPNINNSIIRNSPSENVLKCVESRTTNEIRGKTMTLTTATENNEKRFNHIPFHTNITSENSSDTFIQNINEIGNKQPFSNIVSENYHIKCNKGDCNERLCLTNTSETIQQRLSDTRISNSENSSTVVSDVQPEGICDENLSRKSISKQTRPSKNVSLNRAPESQLQSGGKLSQEGVVDLEIEHDEIDNSASLEYCTSIEAAAAIVLGVDKLNVNRKSTNQSTCSSIGDTSLKDIAYDNGTSGGNRVQVTFNTYLDKFLENNEENKLESPMFDKNANSSPSKKGKGNNNSTVKRKCSNIVPLIEESHGKSPRKIRKSPRSIMSETQIKSKANNNSNEVVIPENANKTHKSRGRRRNTLPEHFQISTEDTPTNSLVKNGKKRSCKEQTPKNSDISQANELNNKRRRGEYERKSASLTPNKKSKVEQTIVSSSPPKKSGRIRKPRNILNL